MSDFILPSNMIVGDLVFVKLWADREDWYKVLNIKKTENWTEKAR